MTPSFQRCTPQGNEFISRRQRRHVVELIHTLHDYMTTVSRNRRPMHCPISHSIIIISRIYRVATPSDTVRPCTLTHHIISFLMDDAHCRLLPLLSLFFPCLLFEYRSTQMTMSDLILFCVTSCCVCSVAKTAARPIFSPFTFRSRHDTRCKRTRVYRRRAQCTYCHRTCSG